MTPVKTFLILVIIVVLILIGSSLYTVREGQQALLLRLGKIVRTSNDQIKVMNPGLHFKLPFIDKVRKLDMRLQTDAAKSSRIYIEKENYFVVDYYVKWRIQNLAEFYTSTGGLATRAEALMEQKIDNGLRAAFGTRSLRDVVAQDRVNIMALLKSQADERVKDLGIDVVDVRLKAIDLPSTVRQSVFDSMVAGRQMVANNYRANGKRVSTQIRADADAGRLTIIASAKRDAQNIQATGLSKAAKIYSDAYSSDPKFYAFFRSITAYKDVFTSLNDILVLKPGGDFFRYFNSIDGVTK